ncbi:MAG: Na+/H+ antiporter subunit E [Gammaproteobacteria bacterium]|nr:Na+/H+ antiporter subunit E [Gammaproteobacteria bacterium]
MPAADAPAPRAPHENNPRHEGRRGVRHAINLGVVLYLLWLALSGHLEAWLLGLGLASAALTVWVAQRMDRADREPQRLRMSARALGYFPWLAWQVVLANLDVARRILHPRMPIDPRVVRLRARQRTRLGRVIYANSITLTPGTVSLDLDEDTITVHALTRQAAEALETGEMDRRAQAVERRP